MAFSDLLPQDPAIGPPLPRFLNIRWPWLSNPAPVESSLDVVNLPTPPNVFGSPASPRWIERQPKPESLPNLTPAYQNDEWISFPDGFDPDTFMPYTIHVHRVYKKPVLDEHRDST